MPDEPIYCYCPLGGGLLHIHRNPPYDTEGRLEMLRRHQEERVFDTTRLLAFEDDGIEPNLPMSPNELKRLASASNHFEVCAVHMNHGDCEDTGCRDEKGQARSATVLVGDRYLCDICADNQDRDRPAPAAEPRMKLGDLK
jgi:hypothetical protein